MCTRSSVTALPDAPGAYGQPPSPPIDASKRTTPRSSAASDVRERGAARVVEVQADAIGGDAGRVERVEQIVHAAGRRHAGGVAEREPVGARVDQVAGELRDPLGRDVTFVGTAERGRHDRLGLDAGRVRELDDVARADQRLRDRALHVLLVVRLARAHHDLELVGAGGDRALGALGVRHERRVDDAGHGARSRPSPLRSRPSAGSPSATRTRPLRSGAARCPTARRSAGPARRPEPAPRSAGRRAGRPHGSRRVAGQSVIRTGYAEAAPISGDAEGPRRSGALLGTARWSVLLDDDCADVLVRDLGQRRGPCCSRPSAACT